MRILTLFAFLFSFFGLQAGSFSPAAPVQAILTDIEGTTTSISFVHEILFPYAKTHVRSYILAHESEPAVTKIIQEVKEIAETPDADLEQVITTLISWMNQDKKITPLKTLQGMMWKEGYEQGGFQGHVYKDAFQELTNWHEQNIPLYVYSSGSVPAQKLLFSHSTYGDLTPLFCNYFDTKVGGKKESSSYRTITAQIGLPAENILFLSDITEELDAAKDAGMQILLLLREETTAPAGCSHPSVATFDEIHLQ